jgi:hypothetical protein
LDGTDIAPLFQQVGGKAMAKGVDGDVLVETGGFGSLPTDALQPTRRYVTRQIVARKQSRLGLLALD